MKQYLKPILPYAVSVYIGAAFMNMCTNLTGSVLYDIMVYYHMNLDRGGMMSFFQFMGASRRLLLSRALPCLQALYMTKSCRMKHLICFIRQLLYCTVILNYSFIQNLPSSAAC